MKAGDPAAERTSETLVTTNSDVVVIGSGVAGMTVALTCGFERVTLLTKTEGLAGGSTHWAQGGIAAAIGADDHPDLHATDTVAVGHDLVPPALAKMLAEEGKDAIEKLISDGFPADVGADGRPVLSREAAHSRRRVVHAGGDATGRHLAAFLAGLVRDEPRISVSANSIVLDVVRQAGEVVGVMAHHVQDGWVFHRAPKVVLATGGIGQVFGQTTNPPECTGDGLALAARAGCSLADLEFVQFHPTALAEDGAVSQRPLLTEALRGDGATLLDENGFRFMKEVHPDLELAPRDVVAKAIWQVILRGHRVYLDIRSIMRSGGIERFPTVVEICRKAGFDPLLEPVPVAPVAHYHMGGVATDENGRSDVPGLWACGEVACTGVHGANRLASNSLLEALVFGTRVANDMIACGPSAYPITAIPRPPQLPALSADTLAELRRELCDLMYRGAGLVRDESGMVSALHGIDEIEAVIHNAAWVRATPDPQNPHEISELSNMLTVARAVLVAALVREESRGAHIRSDFPEAAPKAARNRLTLREIETLAAQWCTPKTSFRAGAGGS
ncbi:MAG: L-aspartate oxidase [Rhodospirillales bacterium]|nr:L-aspartate oxidase [Rhodospirillales bacterium]